MDKKIIDIPQQGYILAVRVWYMGEPMNHLYSRIHYGCEWPPGRPLKASCYAGIRINMKPGMHQKWWLPKHPSPPPLDGEENCSCGIYGVSNYMQLRQFSMVGLVWGFVALWGRIITTVGHDGQIEWRAEYAYPQAFVDFDGIIRSDFWGGSWLINYPTSLVPVDRRRLRLLAKNYGVPVLPYWPDGDEWRTGIRL